MFDAREVHIAQGRHRVRRDPHELAVDVYQDHVVDRRAAGRQTVAAAARIAAVDVEHGRAGSHVERIVAVQPFDRDRLDRRQRQVGPPSQQDAGRRDRGERIVAAGAQRRQTVVGRRATGGPVERDRVARAQARVTNFQGVRCQGAFVADRARRMHERRSLAHRQAARRVQLQGFAVAEVQVRGQHARDPARRHIDARRRTRRSQLVFAVVAVERQRLGRHGQTRHADDRRQTRHLDRAARLFDAHRIVAAAAVDLHRVRIGSRVHVDQRHTRGAQIVDRDRVRAGPRVDIQLFDFGRRDGSHQGPHPGRADRQRAGCRGEVQHVVAVVAFHRIAAVARIPDKRIAASAAGEQIGTRAAGDRVVTRPAVDRVDPRAAGDRIIPRAAVDRVGLAAAGDRVMAQAAVDCRDVHRAADVDRVVAVAAVNDLGDVVCETGQVDVVHAAAGTDVQAVQTRAQHNRTGRQRATGVLIDRHRARTAGHIVGVLAPQHVQHIEPAAAALGCQNAAEGTRRQHRVAGRRGERPGGAVGRGPQEGVVPRRADHVQVVVRAAVPNDRQPGHAARHAQVRHIKIIAVGHLAVAVDRQVFHAGQCNRPADHAGHSLSQQVHRDHIVASRAADRHRIAGRIAVAAFDADAAREQPAGRDRRRIVAAEQLQGQRVQVRRVHRHVPRPLHHARRAHVKRIVAGGADVHQRVVAGIAARVLQAERTGRTQTDVFHGEPIADLQATVVHRRTFAMRNRPRRAYGRSHRQRLVLILAVVDQPFDAVQVDGRRQAARIEAAAVHRVGREVRAVGSRVTGDRDRIASRARIAAVDRDRQRREIVQVQIEVVVAS